MCSECSDNLAPIPNEQLYHPVRICNLCFQDLYPEESAAKMAPKLPTTAKTTMVEEGEASVILDKPNEEDKVEDEV